MHRRLEKNVDAVAVTRQTMKYVREVRRMYYDNGTPPAEIARVLKISMADVAMYLELSLVMAYRKSKCPVPQKRGTGQNYLCLTAISHWQ